MEQWAVYHHPDMGWYVARSDIETDSQEEAEAIYVMVEASAIRLKDKMNANHERERGLREALENMLDEMPGCDVDVVRDYCMTHHTKQCPVAGWVVEYRKLTERGD